MNANDIHKIEELVKTIKEAQRQIEEIKNPKPEIWMPKEGDITSYIHLESTVSKKDDVVVIKNQRRHDVNILDLNDIRYRDDAEKMAESFIFQLKCMRAKSSLCPGYDGDGWGIKRRANGFMIWRYESVRWIEGIVIFDTEEHALQAIKWLTDGSLDLKE